MEDTVGMLKKKSKDELIEIISDLKHKRFLDHGHQERQYYRMQDVIKERDNLSVIVSFLKGELIGK